LRDFTPVSTAAGYLNRQQFLDFLNAGAGAGDTSLADFRRRGLLLTVALLLVGGLALNLTPCVLPLIPINLAILGAGAQARSKGQGFLLGGLYGLAMAITYGTLGLLVVFTGAKFGALNASLGFNIAIAVLFVALALAMFDVIAIDLSRFQSTAGAQGRTGAARYAAAFAMGAVAALLAGACVAPVVISTLLLAGNLYAQGEKAAALLPFLLGLGMGLPWPFAGAGLSFLPKPGKWMTWVKYAFGVMILGLAAYYGKIAWDIYSLQRAQAGTGGGGDPATASTEKFVAALQAAAREGKPVFIDFWATWCKNCHAMEATTFKDAAVRERLKDFIVVKYQAEFPSRSPAKDVLENFGAIGLPTYVVLKPGAVR
jgi:thiol:disulfide interchange protein